ncbi:T9SS type B sorting domain-containing protein [Flagellimonas meridianipacifica]|uniref:Gliding motility-associated-like protein n=1 Tax=Flagellimonas meridianipacifica TaxID=1080225 RepID=A0A2T0MIN6_9FLAO|nr:T9SS type B sorting domain-containing protein [Allomuricauda pacifica]PRX57448.1 gliding motility-associated-like protein [Allomuricauda pacifica]
MTKKLLAALLYFLSSRRKKPSIKFFSNQDELSSRYSKSIFLFLFLFISLHNHAQQIDTWFSAGKGINSPTNGFGLSNPNPITTLGQDGNSVNTWYDIVYFTEQNLIPNPNPVDYPNDPFGSPPGFDYPTPNSGGLAQFLTPSGSTPGLPTVRRNDADNMNFNPIVEFDGSGDGQALHFRSNSRGNVTIFVVFRARGMGNSAETQRLLFGGDVDIQHETFNQNNWTTNLSLGVSDGSRFSVGRTWNPVSMVDAGEFFVSGGINLLAEPAIGVFTRTALMNAERLTTTVNGIPDISVTRNHPLADNDLFYFNRVGKHFNSNDSNRNLTGDVAEILLADFSMSANQRQRVESYLAIKYGITLSNGTQLGSIGGHATYNYLAADGSIIWQADPIYQHDIAGLGKDRFKDTGGGLSLRYYIDQRISKSVNSDAIVTMSTNSDFSTDNLDLTRTTIDGQITGSLNPYEHNYLIWANDNQTINQSNIELPVGIDSRIEREWRVQAVRSASNPIANVSVRINLSSSDILSNGSCTLKLLIDNDLDGNFATGPITQIDATSIDLAGNVYFDNVNFNHLEVFTVGYIDETPDINALPTNPLVCDSYTLPAITGANLTGNEAYYDGPGGTGTQYAPNDVLTSSGTYYIYDETGTTPNCFDEETFVLTVNLSPDIDDLTPDPTVCDSYTLPAITGANLTGNEAYYDGPGGTGTQYAPNNVLTSSGTYYIYDETGTTPNCFDEESFNLTIDATNEAGTATHLDLCGGDPTPYDLNAQLAGADSGGTWRDFDDAFGNGINSVVVDPSNIDFSAIGQGNYDFTYTVSSTGACPSDSATMTVTINTTPIADAPADVESCDSYILPALANGSYFDAPNGGGSALSAGDAITATSTLYVFSPGNGSCPDVENSFVVTINTTPIADAPADVESCDSYILPALANGSYFDAPNGGGSALSAGDAITATSTLYVFSPGNGSCPDVENSFVVTINSLSISLDISHESCWESSDGFIDIIIENGVGPYNVQINTQQVEIFTNESFTINGLNPGNYSISIMDSNGCQTITEFDILPGGPNLDAVIEPIYSCESGAPNSSIMVSLANTSIDSEVLYALDSTELNDFVLTPEFGNIPIGNHFLSILHTNGCLTTIPFTIEETTPVELDLTNSNINEITANASGGTPPYTYFFDDQPGTSNNVFPIDESRTYVVRVLDGNGCEAIETITLNFDGIDIPNFFTPNSDGQNDFWRPRNISPYPNIQTFIFDRYGRKINIMGPLNQGWDGLYESKPLPSGDYWYVIQLNDGSGREFVGHFTLYR